MGFKDIEGLQRRYKGQAGQLATSFFIPVLKEAVRYERQAGYFDSASFVQVATGLAVFVRRYRHAPRPATPPIRLITAATWHPEDTKAYDRGLEALQESLETTLLGIFQPTDEQCYRLGLPPGWRPEEDDIARNRFGSLAWLVAAGLLEVKVALPLDYAGRPQKPGAGGALFHPKVGVFEDAHGEKIGFQGSINETSAAWTRNRESFDVKRSWFHSLDSEDIKSYEAEFVEMWKGEDEGLLILPLPESVKRKLNTYIPPDGPPERDPVEFEEQLGPIPEEVRERARWFLEAPRRPGGDRLVVDPIWVDGQKFTPYPHQETSYRKAFENYPLSYLFCQEVGLGKTIIAALGIRRLILEDRAKRILLLVPKSIIRQWMEELREKFALTAWFYDGYVLTDVAGRVRHTKNAWEEEGIIIASRHLAVRQDRRDEVLGVKRPWDLVIVDEAHAARRRVFGSTDEPNLSLSLLQDLRRKRLYDALWLLTATPMQLATHEVHDLLLLCGLDDPSWRDWKRIAGFEQYFFQLRDFPTKKDVRPWVVEMSRIAVKKGAEDLREDTPPKGWADFKWKAFLKKITNGLGLDLALKNMTAAEAEPLAPRLARQTPLAVHMFRHTRETLRVYKERGLLSAGLAEREPVDAPVTFQNEQERELYERIDELCSKFYKLADLPEEERSGVGFLMAVFRKRLSSSFWSFRKSLERRRDLIKAIQDALEDKALRKALETVFTDEEDDDEEEDQGRALDREQRRLMRLYHDPERREQLEEERLYLQDYITKLTVIDADSKYQVFAETLDRFLAEGHRVIVFTQYLDTLEYIREHLQARFTSQMACYSGRGGEIWDSNINGWRIVDKAEVKARTKPGHPHPVRILLGTDAASEGLNLQSFSALINYDLPWNPMRVEQRIGRIDRLGQQAPTVKIVNLYLRGTIEEETYLTLQQRIGLFHEVVGPLQPILAQMPAIFRRLSRGEIELSEARRLLDEAKRQKPDTAITSFEDYSRTDLEDGSSIHEEVPATQEQLGAWCLSHHAPGMRLTACPEPGESTVGSNGGCYLLAWNDPPAHLGIEPGEEVLVTFSGEVADRHPPTASVEPSNNNRNVREGVRLLTWGDELLTAWLERLAETGEGLTTSRRGASL